MNSLALRGWLLLAGVLALAYAGFVIHRIEHGRAPDEQHADNLAESGPGKFGSRRDAKAEAWPTDRPVADFEFIDQTGTPFSRADLDGQVWIASFFFASCPGPCRQLNQTLAEIGKHVPQDVRFVSFTCDPETDTPDTLERYAKLFEADAARWKFLTGPMRDLQRVSRDSFLVALEKGTHSNYAFVVDRSGTVCGHYSLVDADGPAQLEAAVRKLDAEPAPESQGRTHRAYPRAVGGDSDRRFVALHWDNRRSESPPTNGSKADSWVDSRPGAPQGRYSFAP